MDLECRAFKKKVGNIYELEVALEDVYLEMYYIHQPRSVAMDEKPSKIKVLKL
jgi:hypothetical protein